MSSLTQSELATIASSINEHHRQAVDKAKSALDHAKQAGELLTQAKSLVPHGEWLQWLDANCQVSPRQAQRYMRVSSNWDAIAKNDTVSYLTFRGVAELLAERNSEPAITTTFQSDDLEYEDCDEEPFTTTSSTNELEPEKKTPHVAHNSGENEWYTPQAFIDAAVAVMGGIDLDPASSAIAQQTVKAKRHYTVEQDGLSKHWKGRVWLNPPYSKDLIGRFTERLRLAYEDNHISQAIVLVNNATETAWFQSLLSRASVVCFPDSRIRFLTPGGNTGSPLQGQAFCYFGTQSDRFAEVFRQFGKILRTEAGQ